MHTEKLIDWFEIYVSDLDRAKSFYEKVFDTKLSPVGNPAEDNLRMLAFPDGMSSEGKTSGALVHAKEVKPGGNSTIIYFTSKDCSKEESRVKNAGGEVVRSKMSIGEFGFVCLVKDSEGNLIGIHSNE